MLEMITRISNRMPRESYEELYTKVLKMNTGIDDYIYNEMLNHKKWYDPKTGLRETDYACRDSTMIYRNKSLLMRDGAKIGVEIIQPKELAPNKYGHAVLYVHGAAFQRRVSDINLHTAERLAKFAECPVFVPDYRVGVAYTFDQMINDLVECYMEMLWCGEYNPTHISVIADSSGCTSLLFALSRAAERGLELPHKVVLLSPQAWSIVPAEKLAKGKQQDPSMTGNNLFVTGADVFHNRMAVGKSAEETSTINIDYSLLKDCEILIQTGGDEMFCEDAIALHDEMGKHTLCDLEVYEQMYHNFQTYYSLCPMAHYSWASMVKFMLKDSRRPVASGVNKLNLV